MNRALDAHVPHAPATAHSNAEVERPIFARFPALRARQPWVDLIGGPSPLRVLDADARLWVKQDDRDHPLYGGNKTRKFECVVGEWRARGIREVVTIGAIGTNSGLATACMALQEGISCRIVMFPQPLTATVRANLLAMQRLGARLEYHRDIHRAGIRHALHPLRLHPRCYPLPGGASVPAAVLAFVNAALELRAQVEAGLLPAPAEIVVAAGSLSTFSGLTLGCAIAGLPTRVIGVRVMQESVLGGLVEVCTAAVARRQMQRAAHTLGWAGAIPEPVLVDGVAAGYGVPTTETERTISRFRDEFDIALECTYTAKAADHALRRIDGGARGPVLFWNTWNSRPLEALPKASVQHAFPPAIARALAQHTDEETT